MNNRQLFPPKSRLRLGGTTQMRNNEAVRSRGVIMRALARRMLMDDVVPWKPLPDILQQGGKLLQDVKTDLVNHNNKINKKREEKKSIQIPVQHQKSKISSKNSNSLKIDVKRAVPIAVHHLPHNKTTKTSQNKITTLLPPQAHMTEHTHEVPVSHHYIKKPVRRKSQILEDSFIQGPNNFILSRDKRKQGNVNMEDRKQANEERKMLARQLISQLLPRFPVSSLHRQVVQIPVKVRNTSNGSNSGNNSPVISNVLKPFYDRGKKSSPSPPKTSSPSDNKFFPETSKTSPLIVSSPIENNIFLPKSKTSPPEIPSSNKNKFFAEISTCKTTTSKPSTSLSSSCSPPSSDDYVLKTNQKKHKNLKLKINISSKNNHKLEPDSSKNFEKSKDSKKQNASSIFKTQVKIVDVKKADSVMMKSLQSEIDCDLSERDCEIIKTVDDFDDGISSSNSTASEEESSSNFDKRGKQICVDTVKNELKECDSGLSLDKVDEFEDNNFIKKSITVKKNKNSGLIDTRDNEICKNEENISEKAEQNNCSKDLRKSDELIEENSDDEFVANEKAIEDNTHSFVENVLLSDSFVGNIFLKQDNSVSENKNKSIPLFKSSESQLENKAISSAQVSTSSTSKSLQLNEKVQQELPKFFFPKGEPPKKKRYDEELRQAITKINEIYKNAGKDRLTLREMEPVAVACGLTSYWKSAIFKAASLNEETSTVSKDEVCNMWKKISQSNHDKCSKLVAMLSKRENNFLEFDDFLCLLLDIVECHPGLLFLREAPEFHTRYINTVVARIFYVVNRSWSGQITTSELRRSNFIQVLDLLSEEQDINAVTDYFSYEHFYVVYCKFWELDTDHDLVIDKFDLSRHANGALPMRLIDRLLCGAVTRWDASNHKLSRMSYVDFVWFLISEEDKTTSTSIEYWFRCMDLDGDGYISMYEMEYFYEEQANKLEQLEIEPLPFTDCLCQMLDMVKPSNGDKISLSDLKKCKQAKIFFDTFFNIEKYLEHEQKDPFAPQKDWNDLTERSDWIKYANEEYELLVSEENQQENSIDNFNDDTEAVIREEFAKYALQDEDFNKNIQQNQIDS